MKKITALAIISLIIVLPLLIANVATAEAESYAVPLPGTVATVAAEASEPFKIDLTPIFQAVIALLAALITGKLIPWIKSKTSEKQFENLKAAARVAVFAAEQLYGAAEGDKKLDYAVEKLRENGFDLDADLLREAVESAVYDMNFEKRVDIRMNEREARRIATESKIEMTPSEQGTVLLTPIEEWPAYMLEAFCRMSEIPCDNCVSAEDFVSTIHRAQEALRAERAEAQEAPEAPNAPEEDSEAPVSEAE